MAKEQFGKGGEGFGKEKGRGFFLGERGSLGNFFFVILFFRVRGGGD